MNRSTTEILARESKSRSSNGRMSGWLAVLAVTFVAGGCTQGTLIREATDGGQQPGPTDSATAPEDTSTRDSYQPPDVAPPKSGIDKCVDLEGSEGSEEECHGVSVEASKAIFVAPTGNNANEGTKQLPKRTIVEGIRAANADPAKTMVLAQAGTYDETVELENDFDLIGGYDPNWGRDGSSRTVIRGGNPALQGGDLTETTRVVER